MTTPLRIDAQTPGLVVATVLADGVTVAPSPAALAAEIDAAIAASVASGGAPESVRTAVRDLLRHGGYKPTGRGKPSSEFLAQAAARGEFPRINALVDAGNLVSLATGLPISVLDVDRASGAASGAPAAPLAVRLGAPGESYVFNHAGHAIDVEGLLCVARDGGPCLGNAVKDSMESKIAPTTTRVLGVMWAPETFGQPAITAAAERLAHLFREHAGAASAEVRVTSAQAS